MLNLDLEISSKIIEYLASYNSRRSIRALVNNVNNSFKEENLPFKMTFSHETRKIRVKEIKN